SFDINVPQTNLSGTGAATVTGTFPNYTVNAPAASPQSTLTSSGIGTITSSGTNSFDINVPPASIAITNTAGAAGVSSLSPNNFTINIPAAISPTITGTGIAIVSPTTGNNFTVSVDQPTFAYSQATGSLTSGTSSAYITPNLAYTNNVLTSGPTSNTVTIAPTLSVTGNVLTVGPNTNTVTLPSANSWSIGGNAGINPVTDYLGTSTAADLQLRTSAVARMVIKSGGGILINGLSTNSSLGSGLTVQGAITPNYGQLAIRGNSNGVLSQGFLSFNDNTPARVGAIGDLLTTDSDMHLFSETNLHISSNSNSDIIYVNGATGYVGINTAAPTASLHVNGSVRLVNGSEGLNKVLTSDALGNATWSTATNFAWGLSGNAGTSASNFLGTSDAQPLSIRTNSVSRMTILSSGNIGIGTAAPTGVLDVTGTATTTSAILRVTNTNASNASNALDVSTNANVGVSILHSGAAGTALTINSTASAINAVNSSNSVPSVYAENTGTTVVSAGYFQGGLTTVGKNNAAYYAFRAQSFGGTELMAIQNNGNIGIGTVTATEDLQLERTANANLGIISGTASTSSIRFGYAADHTRGQIRYNNNNDQFNFWTAGTAGRMVIDNIGRVGINTANPTATLHVAGNMRLVDGTEAAGRVLTSDASGNASWQNATASAWGLGGNAATTATNFIGTSDAQPLSIRTNSVQRIYILAAGNVGVGTAAPLGVMDVAGTATTTTAILRVNNTNAANVSGGIEVSTNGNIGLFVQNTNAGGIGVSSSGVGTALYGSSSGVGHGLQVQQTNASIASYAGYLDGGLVTISKNNAGAYAFRAQTNTFTDILVADNNRRVGVNITSPTATFEVSGNVKFSDAVNTSTGYVGSFSNTTAGISGGALEVINAGTRSVGNDGMVIRNLVTKAGGSNSTKTGLTIESTGSWGPATVNQPNRGLFVTVSGADNNYSGIFMGGGMGIGTTAPTASLHVAGTFRLVNGTEAANRVLVSDASGNANWADASGLSWSLLGNSGTNPATNFIGTSDAQPLVMRTNNVEAVRVTTAGNVGVATNNPLAKLEVFATTNSPLLANISGAASSLGGQRLRFSSGDVLDIGFQQSPGYAAWMQAGFSGNAEDILLNPLGGNVGIGTNRPNFYTGTGRYLSLSSSSVYANAPAVFEIQGALNGIGDVAKIDFSGLFTAGTPTNLARISMVNAGSAFQGELAFSTHDGTSLSEALRITSIGRVGINTAAPTATLHVNGTTRLVDGTQGVNKVLTSDASGNASWQNGSRNTGFMVYASVNQTVATGVWTQVLFANEDYDDGVDFAGNQYVAPTAGVYQFNTTVSWTAMANVNGYSFVAFFVNGVAEKYRMCPSHTNYHSNDLSATLKLNAGDVITVRVLHFQGTTESVYGSSNYYTHFSGFRVY
ncbi:MAG: hypothetical protein JNK73_15120, partial [Bacteroidia bacterium]|nr:hypothetical protein [Bacteroidia bacterium]